MKYDRRAIMKKAWIIRRESGCTMSAALKKAWTVAKKGNEMTKKDEIIEKLNKIVAIGNSRDNGYHYELIIKDWANYGKDRTYFKIIETRDKSRHCKEGNYGYFDNIADEYSPVKSLDFDFGGKRI